VPQQSNRSGSIRRRIVDGPNSIGARARAARWQIFSDVFPGIEAMRVIDLGGTVESWRRAPIRPSQVTVLNLTEPGVSTEAWLTPVEGDACAAVDVLERQGLDRNFDLVFSNSLIEHVGGHARRSALAGQVAKLAPYHWVQTPYRYFPIEPHWLFPLMQFLPVPARASVAYRWPLTHTRPDSRAAALSEVQWTELLGVREMRSYFPESQIVKERLAGVPKSLIAVRGPNH
jgi:hypothetical protein